MMLTHIHWQRLEYFMKEKLHHLFSSGRRFSLSFSHCLSSEKLRNSLKKHILIRYEYFFHNEALLFLL